VDCCVVYEAVGGVSYNIIAYADDIVLLAPILAALQCLIDLLHSMATDIYRR